MVGSKTIFYNVRIPGLTTNSIHTVIASYVNVGNLICTSDYVVESMLTNRSVIKQLHNLLAATHVSCIIKVKVFHTQQYELKRLDFRSKPQIFQAHMLLQLHAAVPTT